MAKRSRKTRKNKRVVGYIRVSSAEQVDNYSLGAQREEIEKYCEQQENWELVEVYVDAGHSAWMDKAKVRPEYLRLMEDVETDKFDIVVTHSIDRMSRSISNMFNTLDKLNEYDIEFVSVSESSFNFSGPSGRAMMAVVIAFAEVYSSTLSFHTKKGLRKRVSEGKPLGKPPFGYQLCDDGCIEEEGHDYCHVDERKAAIVKEVFGRYASGVYSMRRIADWVNEQGFTTNGYRAARQNEDVEGNRFTVGEISKILHNHFYIGKLRLATDDDEFEFVDGVQQRIIDESLFDKVKERLDQNPTVNRPQGRSSSHGHLLYRLARCHECGGKVSATAQGTQKTQTYYRWDERATGPTCRFAGRSIVGTAVDADIDRLLSGFALRDDWLDYVLNTYLKNSDIDKILRRKQKLEEQMLRTNRSYRMHGLMTDEEHDREISQLRSELATLKLPEVDGVTKAGKMLKDFPGLWADLTKKERNDLVRTMFDAVYIDFQERRVHALQPKPAFASVIRAMADRSDLQLEETSTMPFSRESSTSPPSKTPPAAPKRARYPRRDQPPPAPLPQTLFYHSTRTLPGRQAQAPLPAASPESPDTPSATLPGIAPQPPALHFGHPVHSCSVILAIAMIIALKQSIPHTARFLAPPHCASSRLSA